MKDIYNTVEEFRALPKEVQAKVINDLSAYDQTHVVLENGRYEVTPDWYLSRFNSRKFIGEWSYKDLAKEIPEVVEARRKYDEEASQYNWEALNY